ncbi:fibronectin type III domain-containing protein [Chryseobacterium sp. Leaf394]|uniref:Ig-like domain-containing protein n=1 Tax=Chryseobacterium sp. Leaf394 TaxID=1736361 RepID=UPI0006F2F463|nr:fibronectin type III domain-containing protein [Chryseobacterium sp. Leaf394]KQS93433.1 hypothetical protein ASG21_00210 [Chryseobacterium sp. Leaf394]
MKNFYNLFGNRQKGYYTLLLLFLVFLQKVTAQVNSYTFSQNNGTYTEITGTTLAPATGNTSATNLNSAVYPLTIPFNFIFNGIIYTNANVSTNGFITFGSTAPATTNTTPISNTATYEGAVSAFGRDISSYFDVSGSSGLISYETIGTAPNRELVIQWKNFRPNSSTAVTNVYSFSFQVRLKETSNVVSVIYNSGSFLVGSTAISGTVQIGLRGANTSDFNNRLNDTTILFDTSTQGTAVANTQSFNTSASTPGMPSAGLSYVWIPPSCLRPGSVSNPASTANTADIQWVAPVVAPSNGYELYYNMTGTVPTASTAASISNITSTSVTIPSLNASSAYFVWVRSVCSASDKSEWSTAGTAKTICAPITDWHENFDTYPTGNIVPDCWARIVGSSNTAQTISSTTPASGTRNLYQITSSAANTTIAVLPEFSNVNAGTHWLRFKARATTTSGSLDIGYVTSATDASTFVNIQTVNITSTSYLAQDAEYKVIVSNSVPANARLAIRNGGVSTAGHFLDDFYWEAKPSCIGPSGISVSNVGPSSAVIGWAASVTPPAAGYDIYYSTSDVMPTASTPPSLTGISTLSTPTGALLPLTKYYVWVRSRCSATDFSAWSTQIVFFRTLCQPAAILSTTAATVCSNNSAVLTASTESGATLTWYDAMNGGNVVGTGTSYTTPQLSTSTAFYVGSSTPIVVGAALPDAISNDGYTLEAGLFFDAVSSFTIAGVYVYPTGTGAGTVTIALQNGGVSPATTIQSITVNLTGTASPYVKTYVPLNFAITPGTNYKLMMLTKSGGVTGLIRESGASWGAYPLTMPGKFSITNGNCCSGNTTSTSYYYFYDWQVTTTCESPRTEVMATVDGGCLSTSETNAENKLKV